MQSQVDQLRERVLGGKKKNQGTLLTDILSMVREFSCLGEIIGREFEVKDSSGKLIYTIHQKPMAIKQMNVLLKEFEIIQKLDNEREAAKWGTKGKGGLNKTRR